MSTYTGMNSKHPNLKLHEFDLADTGGIINYQRLASASRDPDPPHLRYKNNIETVKFSVRGYIKMPSIQCVDTKTVKLYITFGGVDKFIYALEKVFSKKNNYLRISGMLDPSALIQDRDSEYFLNQLANSQSRYTIYNR